MAGVKTRNNFTLSFNGVDLTPYITKHTFPRELEMLDNTTYTSTSNSSTAGDKKYSITIDGLLDLVVDNALGGSTYGDGTKYTLITTQDLGAQTVTHTWTASATVGAEVSSYDTPGGTKELQTFSAAFAISGAPTRTVA